MSNEPERPPFQKGDRVICIDDSPHGFNMNKGLSKGQVYTVHRFVAGNEEIELEDVLWCWKTKRFQPANFHIPGVGEIKLRLRK